MAQVIGLGYIGYQVTDPKGWDFLLQDIFGLQRRDDGGRARQYRVDERHHRISVYPAKQEAIAYIGWEAASRDDLEAIASQVQASGIKVKWGDQKLRDERAVMELIHFTGPDAFRTEVFFNAYNDMYPFRSPLPMVGFNTGGLGLGHVVLFAADRDKTAEWYQNVLGFRLSDYIYWDGEAEATFMHCSPRHHSLAVVNACFGAQGGEFGHLMLEVKDLDDVGRAYDRVLANDIPIAMTLGRHTNDQTTSFYVYTPSGFWLEYGWGGRLVDDETWTPAIYDSTKLWGHEVQPPPVAGFDKRR
jgi:2,3-dihydroxybiphenyl 1,2-dioxygenase